jgi:hypothetical protein
MIDRRVSRVKQLILALLIAATLVPVTACSALMGPSCTDTRWTAGPVAVSQDVALTPDTQANAVLLTIKEGQTIYPDAEYSCTNGGDWLWVQYHGKTGWVVKSHTSSTRNATPAPPAPSKPTSTP